MAEWPEDIEGGTARFLLLRLGGFCLAVFGFSILHFAALAFELSLHEILDELLTELAAFGGLFGLFFTFSPFLLLLFFGVSLLVSFLAVLPLLIAFGMEGSPAFGQTRELFGTPFNGVVPVEL